MSVGRASHFVSWDGGCLFLTRGPGIAPPHAHYAIQIAFSDVPGIRFRSSDREPWTSYDGVVIASRQPHSMDATHSGLNAVLFVEPETREGRALTERYGQRGIAPLAAEALAEVRPCLFAAWLEQRRAAAVVRAAQDVIAELTGGVEPLVVSDERILRATAYIRGHLDAPLTLEEVADVACLSPSRFRHLFVDQTGMALRPYILWRRFLRVWELLSEGVSVSAAAHAAGFADAAHLSRTSKRAFGFPPSAMPMGAPLRDEDQPLRSRGQPFHSRAEKPAPVT
ncbi:MAG TPA: AraC family transcriptional regulator [Longimicrobium sp.]|nr:AraC family transcriptional regulator [Longimicrobium sp.]